MGSKFEWHEVTRNHHVARLVGFSGHPVCEVSRPQENRRDGTKRYWNIQVLSKRTLRTVGLDARDLDACKAEAERLTRDTIEDLHSALRLRGRTEKT